MTQFRKRADIIVTAQRLTQHKMIQTPRGEAEGWPGDWEVTLKVPDRLPEQYPVKHEVFIYVYEPVTDEDRAEFEEMCSWEFDDD